MKTEKRELYIKLEQEIDTLLRQSNQLNNSLGKEYINTIFCSKLEDKRASITEIYHKEKVFFAFGKNVGINVKLVTLKKRIGEINRLREDSNIKFLNKKATTFNSSVLKLGTRMLDQYQTLPVLVNERNILVVAGAGTGKTSTILGKIKYLLIEKKVPTLDILALTYTKASSEDMRKRINIETGIDINVYTFHKLGRTIISEAEGRAPNLTSLNMMEFVGENIKILVDEDPNYRKKLFDYLNYHQYLFKTNFDFNSRKEYENYKRLHPYITLKGETVKSGEEVLIANFLYINGIDYLYERKYIVDTTNKEFSQYFPDFYLTQKGIWLEHFAIDKNNNVPPFFTGHSGKSAKDIYLEGIAWKRKIHKANKTILIETYSYEVFDGSILVALEQKLKENQVQFKSLNDEDLFKELTSNKRALSGLVELFTTVINLARNSDMKAHELQKIRMDRESDYLKNLIFPIFMRYELELTVNNEIDFSDMLNKAITYLATGKYISRYSHVIVDEFQDMTNLTYRFLVALRNSCDYQLMCVGDDWQSIYRFAGSNIDYLTSFEKYFGPTEVFRIRKTYRFGESIAKVSGNFIQMNPIQLKKDLVCDSRRLTFDVGLVKGRYDSYCVDQIAKRLDDLEKSCEVLFIGRYKDDIGILKYNKGFDYFFNSTIQTTQVIYNKRSDLKITFRTVHASKGLESDYVFILNMKDGLYGFPSQIQDNPIFEYFLGRTDTYAFSEERRLFYVALTRARKKVWLIVNQTNHGSFVNELNIIYQSEFEQEFFSCPKCGEKLVKKTGKFGPFIGCSNYPQCSYTRNLKGNTFPRKVQKDN